MHRLQFPESVLLITTMIKLLSTCWIPKIVVYDVLLYPLFFLHNDVVHLVFVYNPAISINAKQNPLKNATHKRATAIQGVTTNQYHQVIVTRAKNPALEKVVLGKFRSNPMDVGTPNKDNPTSRQDNAWCDSHMLVTDWARRGILSFHTDDSGVPVRRAPQIKVCNILQ